MRTLHPHLTSRYLEALLPRHLPLLHRMAGQADSRSAYQELATLMIRSRQGLAGSSGTIGTLVQTLLDTYARRPAMREELQRGAEGAGEAAGQAAAERAVIWPCGCGSMERRRRKEKKCRTRAFFSFFSGFCVTLSPTACP